MIETVNRQAIADFRTAARMIVATHTDGECPRWKVLALMASALGAEVKEAPTGEDRAEALNLIVDFMEAEADPDVRKP